MAVEASRTTVAELQRRLLDPSLPISRRFRALFSLRNLRGAGPREALTAAMEDASCLLAHEAAFALGQRQEPAAQPALERVLKDPAFHPMVRHEAAEALGAIGQLESIEILRSSLSDAAPEVRETCHLALRRIEHAHESPLGVNAAGAVPPQQLAAAMEQATGSLDASVCATSAPLEDADLANNSQQMAGADSSTFLSVDPAKAAPAGASTAELRAVLLDDDADMYDRYSAMFALRNRGGVPAVTALVAAFGAQSALLRHEVAYVLGQLQHKAATEALVRVLADSGEHPMVRHEAAEALGSIADERSIALLRKFEEDADPIVAESCQVALDMLQFELQEDSFQYADVDVLERQVACQSAEVH